MRRIVTVVVCLMIAAAGAGAYLWTRRTPEAPAAGIPLGLADDRAARVSNLRYDVKFQIPSKRSEPVRGSLTARFTLSDAGQALSFDFAQPADQVGAVRANQTAIEPVIGNGHIVIPSRGLVAGDNQIEIDFVAGDAALNRNDDFLYSLFVPARASLALPCFDQPDLKARWTIGLTVPTGLDGGVERPRSQPLPGGRSVVAGDRVRRNAAAADVSGVVRRRGVQRRDGGPQRPRVPDVPSRDRRRQSRAQYATPSSICTRARSPGSRTTRAFPTRSASSTSSLIPSFQFGGMEHAGAIFYNAGGLLLDEAATKNQLLGRATVIPHETAHMWFGDLVTMRWFNDVWMKEVFANFMAAKIVNPSFPDVNHELRFLYQHYPSAYESIAPMARIRSGRTSRTSTKPAVALRRHHLSEGADRHAPARAADGCRRRSATGCASI